VIVNELALALKPALIVNVCLSAFRDSFNPSNVTAAPEAVVYTTESIAEPSISRVSVFPFNAGAAASRLTTTFPKLNEVFLTVVLNDKISSLEPSLIIVLDALDEETESSAPPVISSLEAFT
jgi:hypothetical protein